jgi:hypothetical protein
MRHEAGGDIEGVDCSLGSPGITICHDAYHAFLFVAGAGNPVTTRFFVRPCSQEGCEGEEGAEGAEGGGQAAAAGASAAAGGMPGTAPEGS